MIKHPWLELPVRSAMGLLFLVSATVKVTQTAGIQAYMHAHGVPEVLVWPAAAWEYAAGALLIIGLWVRPIAVLLAGWCVVTAAIFHTNFSDLDQLMNFFKNLTMTGGFIVFAWTGSRRLSFDASLAASRPTP